MKKKKKYAQPKGHTWVFSHEKYVRTKGVIEVYRVEKCVTPRHKHATRAVIIRKIKP
jgi:hypothetical protein